jgi:hypothetical protein
VMDERLSPVVEDVDEDLSDDEYDLLYPSF